MEWITLQQGGFGQPQQQQYWQPLRPFGAIGAIALRAPPPGLGPTPTLIASSQAAFIPPIPPSVMPPPPPPPPPSITSVAYTSSTPLHTPSTALTSPAPNFPLKYDVPKDGVSAPILDRFAKSYIPAWLLKVSEEPAVVVPLLSKPRRMSSAESIPYAETLLPLKFMQKADSEHQATHDDLMTTLRKMYSSGPEWLTLLNASPSQKTQNSRLQQLPELPPLSPSTYAFRILPLLGCEHAARRAQLDGVRLFFTTVLLRDRKEGLFSVEAPSIREGWPPVDLGDLVGLRRLWPETLQGDGHEFEARVTSIRRVDGLLILHCPQLVATLNSTEQSIPCNVLFKPQDHSFYQMHTAVERLHARLISSSGSQVATDWLFPMPSPDPSADLPSRIPGVVLASWHDSELNVEQQHAVRSFVLHRRRQPFLISGAPGSGKTKACIEVVLQILKSDKDAHILVCGASNPSADTLALRLMRHLDPTEMFRLYDPSRGLDEVRSPLLPYTHVDEAGYFGIPPIADVLKKRVIVCACIDAALLELARCANAVVQRFDRHFRATVHPTAAPVGTPVRPHFSHLVIDEAGQALEAELAAALATVVPDPKAKELAELPQILICGDVKQLPPMTVSEAARSFDFDVSLLERLLERPFYANHPAARRNRKKGKAVTLDDCLHFVDLVRNYRSHKSILMLPSTLFYNDTLEACAPQEVQESALTRWQRLPRKDFPILFQHVETSEDWVDEGGSWFNDGERAAVCRLIEQLVEEAGVKPREISVISPFREQVWRVRVRLREKGLGEVDVGNVEALQGAENRVIIISTVRSQQRHRIAEDRERGRGLIFEAQRFNVAMTRAKELLLVVGNAKTLAIDPNWRSFYYFTRRMGAYDGPRVTGLAEESAADISHLEEAFHHATIEENGVNGAGGNADGADPGLLLAGSILRSLGMNNE